MKRVDIQVIHQCPTQAEVEQMTDLTLRTLVAFMELALRKPYFIDRLKAEMIVRANGGTITDSSIR